MPNDVSPRQFLLAKYESDRALELELDKAAARFEIAFFQAVVVLNGIAVTAFLSFLAANFEKLPEKALLGGFRSFIAWIIGLVCGLLGGAVAHFAQGQYAGRLSGIGIVGLRLPGSPGWLGELLLSHLRQHQLSRGDGHRLESPRLHICAPTTSIAEPGFIRHAPLPNRLALTIR